MHHQGWQVAVRTAVGLGLSTLISCQTPHVDLASKPAAVDLRQTPSKGLLFGDNAARALDWPLQGELSSLYGRRHGRFHHGVDIRAKVGSPVLAAAAGVVEFVGRQQGFGKVVILRHEQYRTIYAHLSQMRVARGDRVERRSLLGASGLTGNTTGPHLHFEIRDLKGDSIDPLLMIGKERLLTSRF